ncbi:myosin II light chain [Mactra antiquata]
MGITCSTSPALTKEEQEQERQKGLLLAARYSLPFDIIRKANGITSKQVTEYEKAFATFEKNKAGFIAAKDIGPLFKALGNVATDKEITNLMKMTDTRKNGNVDFEKFGMMLTGFMRRNDPEQEMMQAFGVFDHDGNGYINAEEMRQVMKNLGEKLTDLEVAEMIREADTSGDGMVDYNEFIKLLCKAET